MSGANGGPAMSPHIPLWRPFAIDQILSTLHAGNNQGVKSPAVVFEPEIKRGAAQKKNLLVLQCFYCKQPSWRGKAAQINDRVVPQSERADQIC